jgi:small subunit ribosomal protein S15e
VSSHPLPLPSPPLPFAQAAAEPRKRTFRKFSYRGVDLDALLELPTEELVKLFGARQRRR